MVREGFRPGGTVPNENGETRVRPFKVSRPIDAPIGGLLVDPRFAGAILSFEKIPKLRKSRGYPTNMGLSLEPAP